MQIKLP